MFASVIAPGTIISLLEARCVAALADDRCETSLCWRLMIAIAEMWDVGQRHA